MKIAKLKQNQTQHFFGSGRTDGIGGQHIAADIAKSNGGTTSTRFEEQS